LPSAGDLLRWAEKTQRTIDFILQQQAQAQARAEADTERLREMREADTERLREIREDNEARWARTDERWARTSEEIRALLAIAEIHEGEIATLAETQAEVGERVNALVNTVERLIGERRNGGGRGEENSG